MCVVTLFFCRGSRGACPTFLLSVRLRGALLFWEQLRERGVKRFVRQSRADELRHVLDELFCRYFFLRFFGQRRQVGGGVRFGEGVGVNVELELLYDVKGDV